MTTKELAEIAGVSERTIRRIAENEVGYVFENGKAANYSEREAVEIMRLARKKGFITPRQNAEVRTPIVDNLEMTSFVSSIVSETIKQLLPYIQNQSLQPVQSIPQRKTALPPIDPRKELNMIAKEAGYITGNYSEPWNQIYKHAYYRLGINLRERAKNRGMDTLDYAEAENYIPQLLEIAREIFK